MRNYLRGCLARVPKRLQEVEQASRTETREGASMTSRMVELVLATSTISCALGVNL